VAKKVPKRSCLGCKSVRPKEELARIVRTKKGEVKVDQSGKISGRGAYTCLEDSCIKKAFKGERLTKALRKDISNEEKEYLIKEIEKAKKND